MRSFRTLGAIGGLVVSALGVATITVGLTVASIQPAAASCLPLQLPAPVTPGLVVLVGTVLEVGPTETRLAVDSWYAGAGPSEVVTVIGGRDPGAITSADWRPEAGERDVVVAERTSDGGLTTALCQQAPATPELMTLLEATYGPPQVPPFTPAGSGGPSASPVAGTSLPPCPSPVGPESSPITLPVASGSAGA